MIVRYLTGQRKFRLMMSSWLFGATPHKSNYTRNNTYVPLQVRAHLSSHIYSRKFARQGFFEEGDRVMPRRRADVYYHPTVSDGNLLSGLGPPWQNGKSREGAAQSDYPGAMTDVARYVLQFKANNSMRAATLLDAANGG